jgi:P4 family phage/plasmid primase-like protien
MYVTEKHRHIGPVVIDLDFKFADEERFLKRQYTESILLKFIDVYLAELMLYVDKPSFDVYVLEKSAPRRKVVSNSSVVKDGVHIVITNAVTYPALQLHIRKQVLDQVDFLEHELLCVNNINDIFDEAVIEKNGWLMCGSKKAGANEEPYKVYRHYNIYWDTDKKQFAHDAKIVHPDEPWRYVEPLSIRNKFMESPIHSDQQDFVDKIIQEHQDRLDYIRAQKNIVLASSTNVVNSCDDLEYVEHLVNILNPERAGNYDTWIRVGWCCKSIDNRLLDKWIEFSRKSPKFQDGECERLWRNMKPYGIGIGSLCMWAKQDNPEEYGKLMSMNLYSCLMNSSSETDYDIALVIYNKFKSDFVCSSIKNRIWFEYKNHRWNPCEHGYVLKNKISTDMFMEYNKLVTDFSKKAAEATDEDDQERYTKKCKKFTNISLKMKKTEFKDKMIKECSSLFYKEDFEDKLLDSNPSLIGFENGVYDLDTMEFREGRPEDFISMNTHINYVAYEDTEPHIRDQIMDFMEKVIPNHDVRAYLLMVMSSLLDGNNREEKFYVWAGKGSNGKSKCIELLEKALGDYMCTFNVSLLTNKRGGSGQTNSELVRSKGRRCAVLQEPEENEKMNAGFMKELSGNDKIITRGLYKDSIEFKPMFKMILTCNHLPNLPSEDGGTWRRVRLIEFQSKFTDNPNPRNEHEFAIDRELSLKFDEWKETFMAMLVDIYRTYKEMGGISEPKEVMQCTDNYQKQNDNIGEFLKTYITEKVGEKVFIDDLYAEYKLWFKNESIGGAVPRRKVLETYMDNNLLGTMGRERSRNYWPGYKLCMSSRGLLDDEDEDEDYHEMMMMNAGNGSQK